MGSWYSGKFFVTFCVDGIRRILGKDSPVGKQPAFSAVRSLDRHWVREPRTWLAGGDFSAKYLQPGNPRKIEMETNKRPNILMVISNSSIRTVRARYPGPITLLSAGSSDYFSIFFKTQRPKRLSCTGPYSSRRIWMRASINCRTPKKPNHFKILPFKYFTTATLRQHLDISG